MGKYCTHLLLVKLISKIIINLKHTFRWSAHSERKPQRHAWISCPSDARASIWLMVLGVRLGIEVGAWRDVVAGGGGCWMEGGSGGVSAVVYCCMNALTCGWRLMCLVFGCGLSIWMATSDLVLFLRPLNLSSKAWHLLWSSSVCLSWDSFAAVRSCTYFSCSCWLTRSAREAWVL